MKYIKTERLKCGTRIGHPVYNREGVLCYNIGTEVDPSMIDRMRKMHMYGTYILEPDEKPPVFTREELEFEQFQAMRTETVERILTSIVGRESPRQAIFDELIEEIYQRYCLLHSRFTFNQSLRSEYDFIYKHSLSVTVLTALMAGKTSAEPEEKKALLKAALLHDIGKLYAPSEILHKQDKLSDAELERMNQAILLGMNMLVKEEQLPFITRSYLKQYAEDTCNRLPNYPHTLMDLYPGTRILKVADMYDTLTAIRPYKAPITSFAAINIMKNDPLRYDPRIVDLLSGCIEILPIGSYVVLSTGEKGIVMKENPKDHTRPVVWGLSRNMPYNLAVPTLGEELYIIDCLMTSDNRQRISKEAVEKYIQKLKKAKNKPEA